MKNVLLLPVILFCGILSAQQLDGSWRLVTQNGSEVTDMQVVQIFQDGYFASASKKTEGDEFHSTKGGEFKVTGNKYTVMQDFNTENPQLIGKEINYDIKQEDGKLTISDPVNTFIWERIPEEEDVLSGTWVITGRELNGEMNTMTPGDRRTVKILGGGRFQWIAFNSATQEFSGTGCGTYTAEDGRYIENIDFFSRDNNRVGASLDFQFEIKDGEWHHKGKSSKGDPIYEIWSPYNKAYIKK